MASNQIRRTYEEHFFGKFLQSEVFSAVFVVRFRVQRREPVLVTLPRATGAPLDFDDLHLSRLQNLSCKQRRVFIFASAR